MRDWMPAPTMFRMLSSLILLRSSTIFFSLLGWLGDKDLVGVATGDLPVF